MKILSTSSIIVDRKSNIEELRKKFKRDQKFKAKCENCDSIFERRLRFFSSPLLCKSCSLKYSTRKHYGVDFVSQAKEVKAKKAKTFSEKSETELKAIREKKEQTCLKKFGVSSYFKTQEFKKAMTEHNPGATKKACEKRESTMLKKYGVKNIFQNKEYIQKKFFEKYGVSNPYQLSDVISKSILKKAKNGWPLKCKYIFDNEVFDSKWEVAFYIYMKETHHKVVREPISFKYEFDGKIHVVTPDFKIDDDYVELKGDYLIGNNGKWICVWDRKYDDYFEAKHQCLLKNNVKILVGKDIQPSIDYVTKKYGGQLLEICRVH